MRRRSPEEHWLGREREFVTLETPATFGTEARSDGTAMLRVSATATSPGTGAES